MICSNPVVTFIDSDNTAPGLPTPTGRTARPDVIAALEERCVPCDHGRAHQTTG